MPYVPIFEHALFTDALVQELRLSGPPDYTIKPTGAWKVSEWSLALFSMEDVRSYFVRPGHGVLLTEGAQSYHVEREVFVLAVSPYEPASQLPWELPDGAETRWDIQERMLDDVARAAVRASGNVQAVALITDLDLWPAPDGFAAVEVKLVVGEEIAVDGC